MVFQIYHRIFNMKTAVCCLMMFFWRAMYFWTSFWFNTSRGWIGCSIPKIVPCFPAGSLHQPLGEYMSIYVNILWLMKKTKHIQTPKKCFCFEVLNRLQVPFFPCFGHLRNAKKKCEKKMPTLQQTSCQLTQPFRTRPLEGEIPGGRRGGNPGAGASGDLRRGGARNRRWKSSKMQKVGGHFDRQPGWSVCELRANKISSLKISFHFISFHFMAVEESGSCSRACGKKRLKKHGSGKVLIKINLVGFWKMLTILVGSFRTWLHIWDVKYQVTGALPGRWIRSTHQTFQGTFFTRASEALEHAKLQEQELLKKIQNCHEQLQEQLGLVSEHVAWMFNAF